MPGIPRKKPVYIMKQSSRLSNNLLDAEDGPAIRSRGSGSMCCCEDAAADAPMMDELEEGSIASEKAGRTRSSLSKRRRIQNASRSSMQNYKLWR